jgi:hypothetical protein
MLGIYTVFSPHQIGTLSYSTYMTPKAIRSWTSTCMPLDPPLCLSTSIIQTQPGCLTLMLKSETAVGKTESIHNPFKRHMWHGKFIQAETDGAWACLQTSLA